MLGMYLLIAAALASPAPATGRHVVGVLQGFDIAWESRPHRLRSLGFIVDVRGDAAGNPTGSLTASAQGGSWASGEQARDTPAIELDYAGFSSPVRQPVTGHVQVTVDGRGGTVVRDIVPAKGTARVEVAVPEGTAAVGTFLTGFSIQTDPLHEFGFTLHELEIQLGAPEVVGDRAAFDVTVRFVAAPVPDRAQDLSVYGGTIDVWYAVIPTAVEGVARRAETGRLEHGIELEAGPVTRPVRRNVEVLTDPNGVGAMIGLSGFRVAVDEAGLLSGRYLRELAIRAEELRYDPFLHEADASISLLFSNAGPVTRPISVDVGASITVLSLLPRERTWSGRWDTALEQPLQTVPYPAGLYGSPGTR